MRKYCTLLKFEKKSCYSIFFKIKHRCTLKSTYLLKGRHYNLRSIVIVNKVDETIRSRRGLLDFPRKPKIVGTSHKSVKSTIAQHNTTCIESIQDFLYQLVIKLLSGNQRFFTISCYHQTYQNFNYHLKGPNILIYIPNVIFQCSKSVEYFWVFLRRLEIMFLILLLFIKKMCPIWSALFIIF